jgi:hypothetical protein
MKCLFAKLRSPELSSVALGATICSVSDEFFAEAFHLLKVEVSKQLNTYVLHSCSLNLDLYPACTKHGRVVWTQRRVVFRVGIQETQPNL